MEKMKRKKKCDSETGLSFTVKNTPKILEIAKKLHSDGAIRFLTYAKHFPDGTFFDLGTTNDWAKRFYNAYLNHKYLPIRLVEGINYWKKNKSIELSEIQEDARENFDIDARIDFVYHNNIDDTYHLYAFYASRNNADKAYRFYDIHRGKLLKFISHFNKSSIDLVNEANMLEHKSKTLNYRTIKHIQNKRNYASELQSVGSNLNLTDREFEIMILYANGCNSEQISQMLNRSKNTITAHLQIIRNKTGCHDKKSLHKYVIKNGWEGLEKFFFSYISEKDSELETLH